MSNIVDYVKVKIGCNLVFLEQLEWIFLVVRCFSSSYDLWCGRVRLSNDLAEGHYMSYFFGYGLFA